MERDVNQPKVNDKTFLSWLTLAMIVCSLWLFRPYFHFLIVGAVLALSTSHLYTALLTLFEKRNSESFLYRSREGIAAFGLSSLFLVMIFGPLLYFVSVMYEQAGKLDIESIKQSLTELIDKVVELLDKLPMLEEPLRRLKEEGLSFISGPAVEVAAEGAKGLVSGVSGMVGQIIWILLFYFLFNMYGRKILSFIAHLVPMTYEHQKYLYRECAGTVAVVFYGTIFNMIAQGVAFGVLMIFVGDYDAVYLGALAGFCSVIPIVGAALVYVPVVIIELIHGNVVNSIIVLIFAWVVMGVFIDNVLRMIFIGFLKRMFGFEYTMNEILILLAILAGISTIGFWGLIIGPSILALTLAAANLYSSWSEDKSAVP